MISSAPLVLSMSEKSFEQVIRENGELIYTHKGNSMYPLIKERDLLIIKDVSAPLTRLDIPLYKRDNGKYVLHRIVKVREHDYIISGDNCYDREEGITDKHIIGVLTHIVRKGRTFSVNSPGRRMYAHLICDLFPIRRIIFFFRRIKNHFFSKR